MDRWIGLGLECLAVLAALGTSAGWAQESPPLPDDPAYTSAQPQPPGLEPRSLLGSGDSAAPLRSAPPPSTDPAPPADQAGDPAEAAPNTPAGSSGAARPKKPRPSPYKGVFYDNDFRYLDDPENTECRLGDAWKRLPLGGMVLDLGGEYRLRQHNEHIVLRDNNFLLQRTRLYANLEVNPWIRLYGEAIDAASSFEDISPRVIEENRFDALNLFGDVRLCDGDRADLWLRGGRQELLYGAQRLISPLDWANTRRTFDGVKLFSRGEKWDADLFWTRPVPFAQHVSNDHNFDHPDTSQEFLGLYLTRKRLENSTIDLYYLRLAEYDGRPDFDQSTFGGRCETRHGNWLGEIELGYQLGRFGDRDHSAGFFTVGGGRKLAALPWNTVFWTYFDWASGDDPDARTHGTFNQLFPLGHKYFGYMDLVGRQNIEDLNFLLTIAPVKKVEFQAWWHIFKLDQARDALYDAGGAVVRVDPTGAAGRDVGEELDLLVNWNLTPRSALQFAYCHLFPGDFLLNTPGGAPGRDFYYTQFTVRF